jgi:DNA-binding transcriptional LysR family regulator
MNYNHLYYFYVTARAGSVTEGAAILRVAQPSLSGQIKALESTVNRSLFRRVGRKIVNIAVAFLNLARNLRNPLYRKLALTPVFI